MALNDVVAAVYGDDHKALRSLFDRLKLYITQDPLINTAELCYLAACEAMEISPEPLVHTFVAAAPSSTLDLSLSYQSTYSLLALAITFPFLSSLEIVVFGKQRIDSSMMSILCESMSSLPLLQQIDVSANPIGSLGVQSIVQLARRQVTLCRVSINEIEVVPSLRKKLERLLNCNATPM